MARVSSSDPFGFAADAEALSGGPGSLSVRYGMRSTRGLPDVVDVVETDATGMPINARRRVLRIPAGALGTLPPNARVTLDGAPARVARVTKGEDGDELLDVLHLLG